MTNLSPLYVFYSWNGEMEDGEIVRQMKEFSERGITGVFVHARAGLGLEYFGKEWFDKVRLCVKTAKSLGMEVGLYDENGWPSGFGNGAVNGRGEEFWQKKLILSREPCRGRGKTLAAYAQRKEGWRRVPEAEGELFAVAEYNPGYVDLLAPCVTDAFLSEVHTRYRKELGEEFGKTIRFLFTDEPQLAAPYAYSEGIERLFFETYGYDMLDEAWRLGFETKEFSPFHSDYRSLCARLFHTNFTRKVADWCEANNLYFTGHFACEEHPVTLNLNGGSMNGYAVMQAPGVDALGRRLPPDQLFEQVVSVKNFFGKDYALSETFGCAGWSTSLAEFSRLWANQAARGINLPCLHLSAFSIRGIRKRDYPAFFSYQEPWWNDFGALTRRMRFSAGFVSAPRDSDLLLLTPEYASMGLTPECELDKELSRRYSEITRALVRCQAAFDVVNGPLFDAYASVEGGLTLCGRRYLAVIVASAVALSPRTRELLAAARAAGVPVGFADERPELRGFREKIGATAIGSAEDFFWSVGYRRRVAACLPDGTPDPDVLVHSYGDRFVFFNMDSNATKRMRLYAADAEGLALYAADGTLRRGLKLADGWADAELAPGELLLAEKTALPQEDVHNRRVSTILPVSVLRRDSNALTLDRAKYSVDGGEFSEEMPVLKIEEMLSGTCVENVRVRWSFFAETVPTDLCLAAERGALSATVNGRPVTFGKDWYVDRSICLASIAGLAKVGENMIEFLYQGGKSRSSAALDAENEIERNLFSFDLEIENIYLTGSFSTGTCAFCEDAGILRVSGSDFRILPETSLSPGELTRQGLWFYRGTLCAEYVLPEFENSERVFFSLVGGGQCSARLMRGEETLGILLSERDEIEVTDFSGERLSLLLTVSNRNLLGPHHHVLGDPCVVGGNTFRGVRGFEDEWLPSRYLASTRTEEYCFVRNDLPEIRLSCKEDKR